jgi:hypothetical protein
VNHGRGLLYSYFRLIHPNGFFTKSIFNSKIPVFLKSYFLIQSFFKIGKNLVFIATPPGTPRSPSGLLRPGTVLEVREQGLVVWGREHEVFCERLSVLLRIAGVCLILGGILQRKPEGPLTYAGGGAFAANIFFVGWLNEINGEQDPLSARKVALCFARSLGLTVLAATVPAAAVSAYFLLTYIQE